MPTTAIGATVSTEPYQESQPPIEIHGAERGQWKNTLVMYQADL